MNGLLRRLEKIKKECDVKGKGKVEDEADMDEFTRLKKKIAAELKGILSKFSSISF